MNIESGSVRAGLVGEDPRRSVLVAGIAGALCLLAVGFGSVAQTQGWTEAIDGRLYLVVLAVLLGGGAIAAGNAYWNDGLVGSWLLVFGPVLGWLWTVFVRSGSVFFDAVIVPIAWAGFAATVVGMIGYAVGRLRRGSTDQRSEGDRSERLLGLLLGRGTGRLARWGAVAGGLLILVGALFATTGPVRRLPVAEVTLFELFVPGAALASDTLIGALVLLVWIGVAAVPAVRTAGLLASWGIVSGPVLGAMLADFVIGGLSGSGLLLDATFAVIAALGIGLVVGTVGWVVGTVVRHAIGPAG